MIERRLEHDWFSMPLPQNVELGERSWLYSTFALQHYRSQRPRGLQVGRDTGLYHGTFFDLGPQAEVRIGNHCSIVGAIFSTNGKIFVDDFALIAHEVVIADNELALPPCGGNLSRRSVQPAADDSQITICQNVWIGARAIVLGNIRIGEGAVVGAATLVTEDVPPYTVYAGNPGRVVKQLAAP